MKKKEKIKIGQVVLMNMIKELTVSEIIDKLKYDSIEQRISEVYTHIFREVHDSFPLPDTMVLEDKSTGSTPTPAEVSPLKEEDNLLSPPLQITIAKTSHPYRKHYRPVYLLKTDDTYWGSPQRGVISSTSITFDFAKRSKVGKFAIRDRGDRQGVKNFSLSFSDDMDGPFSVPFGLMKAKTPFKQTFDVTGVGRYCMVSFMSNHGGNVGCKFKVQEVAFY